MTLGYISKSFRKHSLTQTLGKNSNAQSLLCGFRVNVYLRVILESSHKKDFRTGLPCHVGIRVLIPLVPHACAVSMVEIIQPFLPQQLHSPICPLIHTGTRESFNSSRRKTIIEKVCKKPSK